MPQAGIAESHSSNVRPEASRTENLCEEKNLQPAGLRKPVLIMGPSGAGKSALALRLACLCSGVLVNADSIQLYSGLPILSAAPTAEDRRIAPHFLYACFPPGEQIDTARWIEEVTALLRQCASKGKRPIIVGGTGLYFKALTEGLAFVPTIAKEVLAEAQAVCDRLGTAAMRAALCGRDPAHARFHDRRRLVRAWSVYAQTGESIFFWWGRGRGSSPLCLESSYPVVLEPLKDSLHRRLASRQEYMFKNGVVEEVEQFLRHYGHPGGSSGKAIGFTDIAAYIEGKKTLQACKEDMLRSTRHYVKRQYTWIRTQMPGWRRVESVLQAETSLRDAII